MTRTFSDEQTDEQKIVTGRSVPVSDLLLQIIFCLMENESKSFKK